MPLVFVHGVATRQTPAYQAKVTQRDKLFQRLVMGDDKAIYDPDWGSGAVSFGKGGWVPTKGADAEAFNFGSSPLASSQGPSIAAIAAPHDLEQALDLALGSLLERSVAAGTTSEEELRVFEAAVHYLEGTPDREAFAPTESDAQFAQTLESELAPLLPAVQVEAMTVSSVFTRIGQALKTVTDPIRNVGSDAVLKLVRKPLSDQIALFLGDIFVYLRWRETDGAGGTYNRIFKPIIDDLSAANAARKEGQKLILVGHSLGAVILYDLLTDARATAAIEQTSGKPLQVDGWITVGAQPGLFADMGLYNGQRNAQGQLPAPACVKRWMNVYDFTDVLSFRTEPFFTNVTDYEFDNVAGALEAHSAYFQRPGFYKRLRERLGKP